jgi:hypothetical protein
MNNESNKQGWFARNWKWVVPVGCVGMLAMFAAFLASIFLVVFGAMRSSDAYQIAISRARESPEVVEALGEPVEAGWFISGNINVSGPSGDASLSIPVCGPRGAGTIYLVAEKIAGEWVFERLEVELEGSGERLDLLTDSGPERM